MAEKTTTNDQMRPPFFLPSLSLSISSSLTLSDLIPTQRLHCSVAAESISGEASLEKKISSTVSFFFFYVDHIEPNQPSLV